MCDRLVLFYTGTTRKHFNTIENPMAKAQRDIRNMKIYVCRTQFTTQRTQNTPNTNREREERRKNTRTHSVCVWKSRARKLTTKFRNTSVGWNACTYSRRSPHTPKPPKTSKTRKEQKSKVMHIQMRKRDAELNNVWLFNIYPHRTNVQTIPYTRRQSPHRKSLWLCCVLVVYLLRN